MVGCLAFLFISDEPVLVTDEEMQTLAYDIIEGRVMSSRILWTICKQDHDLFEEKLSHVFRCKNLSIKEIEFFKEALKSDVEVFFYSYSPSVVYAQIMNIDTLPSFDNTYYLIGPEIEKLTRFLEQACGERLM